MSSDQKNRNKLRQIVAWAGIVIILVMYVLTFVAALMSSPAANGLFMASLVLTIIIPGAIYVFMWLHKVAKGKKED